MPELSGKMFEFTEVNPDVKPTKLTNEDIGRLCHIYSYICKEHPYIVDYNYRSREMKEVIRHSRDLEVSKIEQQLMLGPNVDTESVIAHSNDT